MKKQYYQKAEVAIEGNFVENVSEFTYLALKFTNKELIDFTGLQVSKPIGKFIGMRQLSS